MRINRFVAAPFVGLSIILLTAMTPMDTSAQNRTVSVRGEGIVEVMPDQAIVRFGIVSADEDPERARVMNAEASRDAMNEVRRLGIEERDMRMETLRLQPQRRYDQQSRNWEEIGFEAVREVRVVVRDLDALPVLIARIVQTGANRLSGITYDLSDREGVRRDALRLAAVSAKEKAELLASTLDSTLGEVVQIVEEGVNIPRPDFQMQEMAMMRSADAAPEPDAYASGVIEVRATLTAVFSLQ